MIKNEKKYFLIDNEQIALWQKEEMLCKVKKADMIEMRYIKFSHAFLMQMNSGYLNIKCPKEALDNKKFASIIFPDDTAIFEISMTLKQAREVSKILGVELIIK